MKRTLSVEKLEGRRLLAVAAIEQETIYVLNRARANPGEYEIEQHLPVDLSSLISRGPLAVNNALMDSSEVKATDMAINDYVNHTSLTGVEANQLARDARFPLLDTLGSEANNIESIAAGTNIDSSQAAINLLTIDDGFPGAPHRVQLFGQNDFFGENREVGVGFATSSTSNFTNYWAIHTATRNQPTSFLTGVVFQDTNQDTRYSAGEGLAGVTIIVGTRTMQTNEQGGWSIAVGAGRYNVVAQGGDFDGVSTATATVSDENVEVDFVSGNVGSQVGLLNEPLRTLTMRSTSTANMESR